jgi:Fe2+ or Zn2+ uptake regulation protein
MTYVPTHTARFIPAISAKLLERTARLKKLNFDFSLATYDCLKLSHDVWLLCDKAGNMFPVKSEKLGIEPKRTSEPNLKIEKPRIRVRGTIRQEVNSFSVQIAV